MARWRAKPENKAIEKSRRKLAYDNNINGLRDKMKAYHEKNKKYLMAKQKEYQKNNPQVREKSVAKRVEINIERNRKARKNLDDHYIVSLMTQHSKINPELIRDQLELIEVYRQNVILKRKIKENDTRG